MRIPKCYDPDCRNNSLKAKSNFCSICKAHKHLKYKENKKIFDYVLYKKIDNTELFEMMAKYNLRFASISSQTFLQKVSVPYLRILLNLEPDQNINSLLKDHTQYASYSAISNGHIIVWLNFKTFNYLFIPEDFKFKKRRIR